MIYNTLQLCVLFCLGIANEILRILSYILTFITWLTLGLSVLYLVRCDTTGTVIMFSAASGFAVIAFMTQYYIKNHAVLLSVLTERIK